MATQSVNRAQADGVRSPLSMCVFVLKWIIEAIPVVIFLGLIACAIYFVVIGRNG